MRIALLAPLPPEQTGIADYAASFKRALETVGIEVSTPLAGLGGNVEAVRRQIEDYDWRGIDLAHAELGGGRLGEFHALDALRTRFPALPLTATAHDPERLVWRGSLPWPLSAAAQLPEPLPKLAALLADPLTLREERRMARRLNRMVALTRTGAASLARRMRVAAEKVAVIPHGNPVIAAAPLPDTGVLRLLYFGFIYRGKGIEDLIDALALCLRRDAALQSRLRLTLAGGSVPETAFGHAGDYPASLRARIADARLNDNIDWALNIPASAIPALIQAHHVMILPYREPARLALLGAMRGTSGALSWARACGRGVITSNARAFAEEVVNTNGITYPQGNIDALADRILALTQDEEMIRQWSRQAHLLAEERAWPNTARRFCELFEKVCQGA